MRRRQRKADERLGSGCGEVALEQVLEALFRKKGAWKKAALSMMSAGAWSNTFDRFARGHVTDYIGFKTGSKKLSSITYNLADFFLAAGALLLSALSFTDGGKE